MSKKGEKSSSLDTFQLLAETMEKERRNRREELLAPLGIKEFFLDGSISIDKRTCQGLECKLCVEAVQLMLFFGGLGRLG